MNYLSLEVAIVIVDIAITYTLLEAVVLLAWHYRTGHGLQPKEYLMNLLSGLCLMLALHSAPRAVWILVPVFLMASGVAHGSAIGIRLRSNKRIEAPSIAGTGQT